MSRRGLLFVCGAAWLSCASLAVAQDRTQFDPCEPTLPAPRYRVAPQMIVHDAGQGVCWLADANLAADPAARTMFGVTGVEPNGSMDFPTAQKWVAALNAYNNGAGYLGHNNWQFPVAPLKDTTCADTGSQGGSFGPDCSGSALGHLYYAGLGQTFPNSVAPGFGATVGPMQNLKLSYYWALQNNGGTGSGIGGGGQEVFSFSSGMQGGTTTKDCFYYVLPVVTGPIGAPPACVAGSAVVPYTSGPAAGKALYDCKTGYTWPANANLAASNNFGITGDTTITFATRTLTVPLINFGAMLFATANQWIAAMNSSQYLGSSAWQMPATWQDLQNLFDDLNLVPGDARMTWNGKEGPFENMQPFFYWGCERDQTGTSQSPCTGYAPPEGTSQLQWTFDFDYGFQSTSSLVQRYFVMVYYPAPPCSYHCCAPATGVRSKPCG